MNTSDFVSKMLDSFPGLLDGDTEVNGGDLVEWISSELKPDPIVESVEPELTVEERIVDNEAALCVMSWIFQTEEEDYKMSRDSEDDVSMHVYALACHAVGRLLPVD